MQEDETLNGEATVAFFKKIEQSYPEKRKIHVFCDNASYYRNGKVKLHLATSKIELHFLPPYSPNLNPIERLWKWMRECVMYNTYYEHFEDFKEGVFGFFDLITNVKPESYFGTIFRSRVRDKFSPIGIPVPDD